MNWTSIGTDHYSGTVKSTQCSYFSCISYDPDVNCIDGILWDHACAHISAHSCIRSAPDPLPLLWVGSGYETTLQATHELHAYPFISTVKQWGLGCSNSKNTYCAFGWGRTIVTWGNIHVTLWSSEGRALCFLMSNRLFRGKLNFYLPENHLPELRLSGTHFCCSEQHHHASQMTFDPHTWAG